MGQDNKNSSRLEILKQQEERWHKIIRNWKAASHQSKCFTIGDINLDHNRWYSPEKHLESMVTETQDQIETEGFRQLVTGITRSWKDQTDSRLDHIWTNCDNLVLNHFNVTRGDSDHNLIGLSISTKHVKIGGQNLRKRKWSKFYPVRCINKFKAIDWSMLFEETNPDIANSILEENIRAVLDSEAPMHTFQCRTKYSKFITDRTKAKMEDRDNARELARRTKDSVDWSAYKSLRNECTRLQKADKNAFLKATYEKI